MIADVLAEIQETWSTAVNAAADAFGEAVHDDNEQLAADLASAAAYEPGDADESYNAEATKEAILPAFDQKISAARELYNDSVAKANAQREAALGGRV